MITGLITSAFYIIISIISLAIGRLIFYGFILFADLEFLGGSIFGLVYFFRNREKHQDFLKYGILVGVLGGALSCIFISIYQTIIAMITVQAPIFVLFLYIGFTFLSGAIIGLLTGTILAVIYMYKDVKVDNIEKEHFDDKFFNDLIDK